MSEKTEQQINFLKDLSKELSLNVLTFYLIEVGALKLDDKHLLSEAEGARTHLNLCMEALARIKSKLEDNLIASKIKEEFMGGVKNK